MIHRGKICLTHFLKITRASKCEISAQRQKMCIYSAFGSKKCQIGSDMFFSTNYMLLTMQ